MNDLIRVSDTSELIYWADVFRIFGIKRCQSLLGRIGVAATAASRPTHLMEAALHFWRANWEGIRIHGRRVGAGYADPGFPENYRLGVELLLQDCFAIIRDQYDPDTAIALSRWARRFFIDQDQVNLWFTWSILFASINVPEVVSSEQSLLPGTLQNVIQAHFGPSAQEDDARALENLQRVPISKLERRMIILEATQPSDIPEVDLTALVRRTLQFNHAYESWRVFKESFSANDAESLLWWGYQRAEVLGMPVEEVSLPAFPD